MSSPLSPPIPDYRILRIPTTSPHLPDLTSKFCATKLSALLADPASFSASHADELLLPLQTWHERLSPPSAILVCVDTPSNADLNDEEALLAGEWIGMATLRGPLLSATYALPEYTPTKPSDPSCETRWHLSNLWVSSAHRGRGIAKNIVNSCVEHAVGETRALGKEAARIRLIIKDEGSFLKRMYAGMGFEAAGRASLREAYGASGDGAGVPEDTDSTEELRRVWETRYGVVMERIVGYML